MSDLVERLKQLDKNNRKPNLCVVCAGEPVQKGPGWSLCGRENCFQKLQTALKEVNK